MRKDLIPGTQFGRLVVLGIAPKVSSRGECYYHCGCLCGLETVVRGGHLRSGCTLSCGCLQRELTSIRFFKHGGSISRTREWRIWCGIKGRCLVPTNSVYYAYGARGITICEAWRDDFEIFLLDVGACPSEGHTIDRIDNDKGYEPGNVRWATWSEQMRNRRWPFFKRKCA